MIHSSSRLEGFSDSVFAFAATLIVVSFEVPDTMDQMKELSIGFISFGISFLALALIWKLHYNFFRRIDRIDNWVIAYNMILLFVILFYVYPMKFLANSFIGKARFQNMEELSYLFSMYNVGFVLIFICFTLLYRHQSKNHPDPKSKSLRFWSNHFLIFVVVGVLSTAITYSGVGMRYGVPGYVYALLGPLCYWHGRKYGKNMVE